MTVVALGNFDGMHLGHQALIRRTVDLAQTLGATPCVWSFADAPYPTGRVLTNAREKQALWEQMGIIHTEFTPFDRVKDMSCQDFVDRILLEHLKACHVVCGFNYTFGKNAAGNARLLGELLQKRGVGLTVENAVSLAGAPISSTRIRACLAQGRPQEAAALLGRPYGLTGPVEHGRALGRSLGFPTLNQAVSPERAPLRRGVYATRVHTPLGCFPAVTNLGLRPTVKGEGLICESHLLGFSGQLYKETVTTHFLHFLRDEKAFAGLEELKEQIQRDIKEGSDYFEREA